MGTHLQCWFPSITARMCLSSRSQICTGRSSRSRHESGFPAGAASQPKKTLPVGAICVSCIATPGLVVITSEEAQTNQQINTVVPRSTDESYFWFWSLHNLGDEIRAGGSGGSVLTNLSTGRFAELRILTPPTRLRSSYHSFVAPVFSRILANEHEANTLGALRDALLPKLLSGEIRLAMFNVPENISDSVPMMK